MIMYFLPRHLSKPLFIFIALVLSSFLNAQPSGGPYGPVKQNFEIPKTTGKIYYVAPDGKPEAPGDQLSNPTTVEAAIEKAVSGDAIVVRGGVYRTGNLVFNQGIILQAYADEQPVFKGTYEAKEWEALGNGLWRTTWSQLFPSAPADWWEIGRHGKETPLHRFNNDMVFVDGRFLQSAGWMGEVDENTFFIDYDKGHVYIGTNPENRQVEITAFNVALHRVTGEVHGKTSDRKGPVVRGIVFTQYAYRAVEIVGTDPEGVVSESEFGKDVVGTVFEHCTFSYCSRVAAYLRGDQLTMRHCKVSDTSTEGIFLLSSSDCLFEKNIFTRNNIEGITGYFPAAVKIFNQTRRVTCRDNLVIDLPNSNGIWYDVGNVDGVFVNNWVEGVGSVEGPGSSNRVWPSDNGFFFEISKGAICAGNVFVNCDHGVLVLNSSNVRMYNNTFVNSTACIARDTRSAEGDHFGWHPATGPGVDERFGHEFVNNLLTGDKDFHRPLLLVWQPRELCQRLNQSPFREFDHNVLVRNEENPYQTLVFWSPAGNDRCQEAVSSLEQLKNISGDSENTLVYKDNLSPFRSVELGNYQLMPDLSEIKAATSIPESISKILGIKAKPYVGAYR